MADARRHAGLVVGTGYPAFGRKDVVMSSVEARCVAERGVSMW